MSKYTTYKIGGEAKYFIQPFNEKSLVDLIDTLKENNLNYFVLGGGSNLLFSDNGYNGAVIKLAGDFDKVEININKQECICGSAVSSAKLLNTFIDNNCIGLEFLAGIPGLIGGAIKMNAGRKTE